MSKQTGTRCDPSCDNIRSTVFLLQLRCSNGAISKERVSKDLLCNPGFHRSLHFLTVDNSVSFELFHRLSWRTAIFNGPLPIGKSFLHEAQAYASA